MTSVFVFSGSNLDLPGAWEPATYGVATFSDIEAGPAGPHRAQGVERATSIHEAEKAEIPIILNAGAYTHPAIALHDAIMGAKANCIDVNLLHVGAGEDSRRHFCISPVARE